MKKVICLALAIIFICNIAMATEVVYRFKQEHVAKIIDGTCYLYKNTETIPDPAWVDPEDGTLPPQIPKWSDSAWTKEVYRRIIIRDTRRGLVLKQRDMEKGINIPDDAVGIQ